MWEARHSLVAVSTKGTEQPKWIFDTKIVLDEIFLLIFSSWGCEKLQKRLWTGVGVTYVPSKLHSADLTCRQS